MPEYIIHSDGDRVRGVFDSLVFHLGEPDLSRPYEPVFAVEQSPSGENIEVFIGVMQEGTYYFCGRQPQITREDLMIHSDSNTAYPGSLCPADPRHSSSDNPDRGCIDPTTPTQEPVHMEHPKRDRSQRIRRFFRNRWTMFWYMWKFSAAVAIPLISTGNSWKQSLITGMLFFVFKEIVLHVNTEASGLMPDDEGYTSAADIKEFLILTVGLTILLLILQKLGG